MPKLLHRLVVVFSCAALVACTSMRTVVDGSSTPERPAAASQPVLHPNDSLTVTTRDGAQVKVHLTTSTQEFIEATQDSDHQLRRIALADVVKIERREFSGLKTVFLVFSIAAVLYALAVASVQASLASGI